MENAGPGSRGVENTGSVGNTGCGEHGVSVENSESKCKTQGNG